MRLGCSFIRGRSRVLELPFLLDRNFFGDGEVVGDEQNEHDAKSGHATVDHAIGGRSDPTTLGIVEVANLDDGVLEQRGHFDGTRAISKLNLLQHLWR